METGETPVPKSEWPQLQYVLQGIRCPQAPSIKRVHFPLTAEVIRILQATLFSPSTPMQDHQRVMLWAACCIRYFGFMRTGELTASRFNQGEQLAISDVAVDSHSSPTIVRLFLRKAMTDPFRTGVHIFLGEDQFPHVSSGCSPELLVMPPSNRRTPLGLGRLPPITKPACFGDQENSEEGWP